MSGKRLAWALPHVLAHRCGGALAPENTLAGLRLAARLGFSAVEFDVMLSADGTPWLLHDETLERTTNGRGPLAATADRVLAGLDAGAAHHPAFAGEPLPTLAAAEAYFERVLTRHPDQKLPPVPQSFTALAHCTVPPLMQELIGPYLAHARRIGQCTAELHRALASAKGPNFTPEPTTTLQARAEFQLA
ncbi:MAG TPA: glycerophosphodiester phosphodiesterase family protein, partial [Accumulibacter sp.]|uniref:glycerophosphodiester phosphodiesterase family protein n=1 Tax=Accumulibacter sp. TaxID=2053492 RepID=UPI002BE03A0E